DAVELLEQEAVGSESLSTQGLQTEEEISGFRVEVEDKLGEAKEYLPELYLPGYISEGYAFVELEIRHTSSEAFVAEYVYENGEGDMLFLHQRQKVKDGGSLSADYIVEGETIEGGVAYYQEDPETGINNYAYYLEGGLELYAAGRLAREELKNILEHFLP
ncbi:MAG: hypothetical protein Q4C22_08250, partial [Bacillota bacterium]|nr:hypothetical protein [Bacillota bacterium]